MVQAARRTPSSPTYGGALDICMIISRNHSMNRISKRPAKSKPEFDFNQSID